MPLNKDWREFLELFHSNGVEYLVGAFAVAFHGFPRYTGDLDLLVLPFIGRSELLRNKEQIGRAKDLGDVEELRKRIVKSGN